MTDFITGGMGIVYGIIVVVISFVGVWFHGKSKGTTQAETKATIDNAKKEVADTKAAAQQEVKVVKAASDAKKETSALGDDDLRERMRTKYTK